MVPPIWGLCRLEIDRQFGLPLAVTAIRDEQPFHRITTLEIAFDAPIPEEVFRFEPPEGEQIQPTRGRHRVQHVTLTEAQQLAPFTVLMPDTVPTTWQVQCRLIEASQRPPSPVQIGLSYHSTDGHESVSITQMSADASHPHRHIGDEEDWEEVTRDGTTIRTRPGHWGQAQAQLERDGTFVYLMSDNLTREQLLRLASGLRSAPSSSEI